MPFDVSFPQLTRNERIRLLAVIGIPTKEIAVCMGLTRNYINYLLRKIKGVKNETEKLHLK